MSSHAPELLAEPLSVTRTRKHVTLEVPDARLVVQGSRERAHAAPDGTARLVLYPGHRMALRQLVPANWAPLEIIHSTQDRRVMRVTRTKHGPLLMGGKPVELYVKPTPKTFHIDGEPVGPANRFASWEARIAHYLLKKGVRISRPVGHYERPNGEHYSIFVGVQPEEPLFPWSRGDRTEALEALTDKIRMLGVNANDLRENGNVQWTSKGPVIVDCNRFTLRPSHPDFKEYLLDAGAVGLPVRQPREKGRH